MKVTAINGSARKNGNTSRLLKMVCKQLEKEKIETELVEMAGMTVKGCIGCMNCFKNKDKKCSVTDDDLNSCLAKMVEADGILLGSPTYFADVTANMKGLIERAGMVAKANGEMFQRKPGAGVVAVRRAGAMHVFNTLNGFFLISQMMIVGSSYWNIGRGRDVGEVEKDDEGVRTMENLGKNMAWLLHKIA